MSPLSLKSAQLQAEPRFKLPGTLPAGERILWQGAPTWRALARHALHIRGLAIYLAVIVAWVAISGLRHGSPLNQVAANTGLAALVAMAPIAIALAYAWLAARNTAYTITNRRIVIRMGVALTMTLNLPFAQIDAAALSDNHDGTGGVAVKLMRGTKGLGWVIMWPHVRPWHFGVAQPMLRAIADAPRAGQILGRALAESADMPVVVAPDAIIVDTPVCHPAATVAAA